MQFKYAQTEIAVCTVNNVVMETCHKYIYTSAYVDISIIAETPDPLPQNQYWYIEVQLENVFLFTGWPWSIPYKWFGRYV